MTTTPEYPDALSELAEIDLWPADTDETIDLEVEPEWPYPDENSLAIWTRNDDDADPHTFLPFAQDGTGGLVGFWDETGSLPIEQRPIVFLGSEGEIGAVAANLSDLLWLLAQGTGPMEVVSFGGLAVEPLPEVVELAERYCTTPKRPIEELVADGRAAVPDFPQTIAKLAGW